MDSEIFDAAVNHAMLYEVGGHWKLTDAACKGLIDTKANRLACGYVDDPDDLGGETKYGISKAGNPDIDIKKLDWEGAKRIYYDRYWVKGGCENLPHRLAFLHFDGCVNHGVGRANKFLATAINAVGGIDKPFEDVDFENLSPSKLDKLERAASIATCHKICDLREDFYRAIVANKPNQAKFLNGWLRRIDEMRNFIADPDKEF